MIVKLDILTVRYSLTVEYEGQVPVVKNEIGPVKDEDRSWAVELLKEYNKPKKA